MNNANETMRVDFGVRLALVSGATGGIGMAVCQRLLEDGYRVVMLGRSAPRLAAAQQTLLEACQGNAAERLFTQVIDIADPSSVDEAAAAIRQRNGEVTDLVHAAGDGPVAPLLETTESMWNGTVQGKLLGTVRLTKAIAAGMVQRYFGNIVIVNGVFSREADPLFPINTMVNSGLSGFAKAISHDLGRSRVRVNVVNPGATETPLWRQICHSIAERLGTTADAIDQQARTNAPSGAIATPADIANVVAFLLSPGSAHLLGATVNVDGGSTKTVG
ncbi:SDR family oxidoreductase [Comamonas testosteroni]|uniref:SDR family NAD(P)-dependent oxidoreductase n=1 Tax=Comamonas testosteroni TaxID=285 RepID=UPI0023AAD9A5|nr:SDR family oxidoreductase [Comamonas testosteroni]WEE75414.1 SDR family oxidoreductase [Comamonas testosteroni]